MTTDQDRDRDLDAFIVTVLKCFGPLWADASAELQDGTLLAWRVYLN